MAEPRSNAVVLDVLFAVALGEGFIGGIYEFKDALISGEVLGLGPTGQGFYRVLLGFLIILLSWLHYRRSTMVAREYPAGEFIIDVLVVVIYMALFLFVQAPAAFYSLLAVIWILYVSARYRLWRKAPAYLGFGIAFIGIFAAVAVTSSNQPDVAQEWARLLVVTIAIVIYRPLDGWFMRRLGENPGVAVRNSQG
jgi:hypothetical protein